MLGGFGSTECHYSEDKSNSPALCLGRIAVLHHARIRLRRIHPIPQNSRPAVLVAVIRTGICTNNLVKAQEHQFRPCSHQKPQNYGQVP